MATKETSTKRVSAKSSLKTPGGGQSKLLRETPEDKSGKGGAKGGGKGGGRNKATVSDPVTKANSGGAVGNGKKKPKKNPNG